MIARDQATAHYAMGVVLTFTNRAAEGVAALERALALNRNLVVAHGTLGAAKNYLGRSEETEAHVHAALRLSPRDPSAFHWMVVAGGAAIPLGRDEEAKSFGSAGRSRPMRAFRLRIFFSPAAPSNFGRLDEARKAVESGLTLASDIVDQADPRP